METEKTSLVQKFKEAQASSDHNHKLLENIVARITKLDAYISSLDSLTKKAQEKINSAKEVCQRFFIYFTSDTLMF